MKEVGKTEDKVGLLKITWHRVIIKKKEKVEKRKEEGEIMKNKEI